MIYTSNSLGPFFFYIYFSQVYWETSLQLVTVTTNSKNDETLEINPETLKKLQELQKPFSAIAIVGRLRIGKSYFLNKMAKKAEVFKTSDSFETCTKGIWVSCIPHPSAKRNVLIFDTEGLFDPEADNQEIGSKLFTLVALLTSEIVLYLKDHVDGSIIYTLQYPLIKTTIF